MTSKRKQQEQFVQNLLKTSKNDPDRPCRFSHKEAVSLLKLFSQFSGGNTHRLERTQFRDELCNWFRITDDFLMDRIFRAFDKGSKGYLRADDFICGMSTMVVGELEDMMKYCFQVYDLNSDGYISREEMFHLLKNTLVKQSTEEDPDEGVKELVETALKKLDMDHDGRVSYADFRTAVLSENLILEFLGTCLPTDKHSQGVRGFRTRRNKDWVDPHRRGEHHRQHCLEASFLQLRQTSARREFLEHIRHQ